MKTTLESAVETEIIYDNNEGDSAVVDRSNYRFEKRTTVREVGVDEVRRLSVRRIHRPTARWPDGCGRDWRGGDGCGDECGWDTLFRVTPITSFGFYTRVRNTGKRVKRTLIWIFSSFLGPTAFQCDVEKLLRFEHFFFHTYLPAIRPLHYNDNNILITCFVLKRKAGHVSWGGMDV